MKRLPQHKAAALSDCGLLLRSISQEISGHEPACYAHQDDYYIFGMVEKGLCRCVIDFNEHSLAAGDLAIIQPWQVHRFISSESAEARALIADGSYISPSAKKILDEFGLTSSVFTPDEKCRAELRQLTDIINNRLASDKSGHALNILRSLAETYINIVAEAAGKTVHAVSTSGSRKMEITLAFRSLLADEVRSNRSPAWYASQLNISVSYLNESVRSVTGMSVSSYIRNEVVLQAKRMLVHTGSSVKEIALALGFDEPAYFTRLFSMTAGASPTAFRQKYREQSKFCSVFCNTLQ